MGSHNNHFGIYTKSLEYFDICARYDPMVSVAKERPTILPKPLLGLARMKVPANIIIFFRSSSVAAYLFHENMSNGGT